MSVKRFELGQITRLSDKFRNLDDGMKVLENSTRLLELRIDQMMRDVFGVGGPFCYILPKQKRFHRTVEWTGFRRPPLYKA